MAKRIECEETDKVGPEDTTLKKKKQPLASACCGCNNPHVLQKLCFWRSQCKIRETYILVDALQAPIEPI
jgi:hypothetical protein